jgi:hypothetical protein
MACRTNVMKLLCSILRLSGTMILLVYVLLAAACTRLGAPGRRREHVDLEVHRTLDHNSTERPHGGRQLSVLGDRQAVTGLPETMIRASAYAELDGKRRDNDLYWFGLSE